VIAPAALLAFAAYLNPNKSPEFLHAAQVFVDD